MTRHVYHGFSRHGRPRWRRQPIYHSGEHRRWWRAALHQMMLSGSAPVTYMLLDLAIMPLAPDGASIRVHRTIYKFSKGILRADS